MKKFMLFAALAALITFASGCKKDNQDTNEISFGKETASLNLGPCGSFDSSGKIAGAGYHFDCDFIINGVSCHIFITASKSCASKKVNLGSFDSGVIYHFEINSDYKANYIYDIHQYNEPEYESAISHSSVGTWFKSGTMQIKDNGKDLVLNASGTLQDGRSFKLNITTKSQKFE